MLVIFSQNTAEEEIVLQIIIPHTYLYVCIWATKNSKTNNNRKLVKKL